MTRRELLLALAVAGLSPAALAQASPVEGQKLTTKGFDMLKAGKPGEALAILKEAARQDPGDPWLHNLLGRAYLESGDSFHARESFSTALRIDPGDGYSRMMLDMLSQHPIPVPKTGEAASRKRSSQLDTEAGAELDAFIKDGSRGSKRLVVIDPGHGGGDPGVAGASGLLEKNVCLDLASRLAGALNASETVTAVLTRDADYHMPLWARSAVAGVYAADLLVSLHCSAGLAAFSGVEAYTYSGAPADEEAKAVAETENGVVRFERTVTFVRPDHGAAGMLGAWKTGRDAAAGKEAAGRIHAALAGETPPAPVRVSSGPFTVLAGCPCACVLVEAGLLSSASDEEKLKKPEYLEMITRGVAKALT